VRATMRPLDRGNRLGQAVRSRRTGIFVGVEPTSVFMLTIVAPSRATFSEPRRTGSRRGEGRVGWRSPEGGTTTFAEGVHRGRNRVAARLSRSGAAFHMEHEISQDGKANDAIERGQSSSPGSIISMIFLGEPRSACFVLEISSAVNWLAGSLLSNRFRSKLCVASRTSQRTVAALSVLFLSGAGCSPKVGLRKTEVARALSALRSDLRLGCSSATCPTRVRAALIRNGRSPRNVDLGKGDTTYLDFEREGRLDCRGGKYSALRLTRCRGASGIRCGRRPDRRARRRG
jgi:hypothetical protein